MSLITPDRVLVVLPLLAGLIAYLLVGFIALLAAHRDDRVDRLTRRWDDADACLAWAMWPAVLGWLLWRVRRG